VQAWTDGSALGAHNSLVRKLLAYQPPVSSVPRIPIIEATPFTFVFIFFLPPHISCLSHTTLQVSNPASIRKPSAEDLDSIVANRRGWGSPQQNDSPEKAPGRETPPTNRPHENIFRPAAPPLGLLHLTGSLPIVSRYTLQVRGAGPADHPPSLLSAAFKEIWIAQARSHFTFLFAAFQRHIPRLKSTPWPLSHLSRNLSQQPLRASEMTRLSFSLALLLFSLLPVVFAGAFLNTTTTSGGITSSASSQSTAVSTNSSSATVVKSTTIVTTTPSGSQATVTSFVGPSSTNAAHTSSTASAALQSKATRLEMYSSLTLAISALSILIFAII